MKEREKTEKEIENRLLTRLETYLQRKLASRLETQPEWIKTHEPGIKHVIGILRKSREKLNEDSKTDDSN